MSLLGNNVYVNAVRNINNLLDADHKKQSTWMFALLLVNACFDVIGFAAIFPLVDAASNFSNIQEKGYLRFLYELFGVSDEVTFLFILSICVFLALLLKNILSLAILYVQTKFIYDIALRLSQKQFHHYYQKGYLNIQEDDSGKKTYKLVTLPNIFASNYFLQTLAFTTEIVILGIILLSILFFQPTLALVLGMTVGPTLLIIYKWTKVRVRVIGEKKNILYPKSYAKSLEVLNGYPDIKLNNKESYFFQQFTRLIEKINYLEVWTMGFYQKIPPKMNEIIVGIGIMILFLFAVLFPAYQTDLLLILGGFGLAAFKIMPSINRMMYSLILIKNVSYVISELKSIKNIKIQAFQEVSPLTFEKELAFKNISYQYPSSSNKVIKELSFTIKKGETVGFIGESGAGKSTLLNLILRFVTETSGNVEIDGVKLVSELGPNYQKLIGYVPQEVFIKEGTLRENIAFGDNTEDIDDKSILKAVKDAAMLDFVNNHPDGLDMQLGENGADLSGGQKQRIGIARVIYQDAPIMVFDEITSALDKDTEKSIIETIGQLANQNKTIIIVAHRLSTLEMANRIYELNNGEIANIYQFKELATLN